MATDRRRKPAKKKPAPIPPDKRGRRGHRAVDDDPALREWLKAALQRRPAPTLDELVEEARGSGFAVGRTAVWEFRVAFEAERARKELVLELSRIYNETSKDGSILDTETALAQLFSSRIYTTMLGKSILDEESLNLLDAFRKLQSSSAQRERTRFQVERGIRGITLRIRSEMQALLKKDPDTLRVVLAAIDQAAAEVRD